MAEAVGHQETSREDPGTRLRGAGPWRKRQWWEDQAG